MAIRGLVIGFFFTLSEIDIYYYKITPDNASFAGPLQEGNNYLDGNETIYLRKGKTSYSISVKSDTFHHDNSDRRFVKVIFRPEFMNTMNWNWWSMYVYISNADDSYAFDVAYFRRFITGGLPMEAILRPFMYDLFYVKPKITKLLKDKTGCRDEHFFELFQHEFVKNVKEICGAYACRPTELPDNPIRSCETEEEFTCASNVLRESLQKSIFLRTVPCSRIEYNGVQKGQQELLDIVKQVILISM